MAATDADLARFLTAAGDALHRKASIAAELDALEQRRDQLHAELADIETQIASWDTIADVANLVDACRRDVQPAPKD